MDLNDEALIQTFRQTRDPAYFKALVRRYEHRLYGAVLKILDNPEESEEVVQDTFIKVHQNVGEFKSRCSFAAWLFRIAHNACFDRLRSRRRRHLFQFWTFDPTSVSDKEGTEESLYTVAQAKDPGLNPAEKMDAGEQSSVIQQSLQKLPEYQRVVVVLHDVEGFSYNEIAEIVGASIGTVRSRLHYGRIKLKELLEPYFEQRDTAQVPR